MKYKKYETTNDTFVFAFGLRCFPYLNGFLPLRTYLLDFVTYKSYSCQEGIARVDEYIVFGEVS
jgi:hypothetical protein